MDRATLRNDDHVSGVSAPLLSGETRRRQSVVDIDSPLQPWLLAPRSTIHNWRATAIRLSRSSPTSRAPMQLPSGILVILVVDELFNFHPKDVDVLADMNHPFLVNFNRQTTDIVCSISKNNHANVLSFFQGDVLGLGLV
jgi:hypothetical protein